MGKVLGASLGADTNIFGRLYRGSSSNTGKLLLEGYSQACAAKIKSKINRVTGKTT